MHAHTRIAFSGPTRSISQPSCRDERAVAGSLLHALIRGPGQGVRHSSPLTIKTEIVGLRFERTSMLPVPVLAGIIEGCQRPCWYVFGVTVVRIISWARLVSLPIFVSPDEPGRRAKRSHLSLAPTLPTNSKSIRWAWSITLLSWRPHRAIT